MKFLTQYNIDDTLKHSDKTAILCKDPTLARQEFKDQCDINILFGKYLETGEIPQVMDQGLSYGDFTGIFDYQTAMNAVRAAQESFDQLPAKIKNRFDNDPNKLLHFLEEPENREEAEFLQLVKRKEPEPAPPPTVGPQPAGGTQPAPQATAPGGNNSGGNPPPQPGLPA